MRQSSSRIVYEHKVTKERIELHKITPGLWFKMEGDKRILLKKKDLEDWKYLKNESRHGWKAQGNFMGLNK